METEILFNKLKNVEWMFKFTHQIFSDLETTYINVYSHKHFYLNNYVRSQSKTAG